MQQCGARLQRRIQVGALQHVDGRDGGGGGKYFAEREYGWEGLGMKLEASMSLRCGQNLLLSNLANPPSCDWKPTEYAPFVSFSRSPSLFS